MMVKPGDVIQFVGEPDQMKLGLVHVLLVLLKTLNVPSEQWERYEYRAKAF